MVIATDCARSEKPRLTENCVSATKPSVPMPLSSPGVGADMNVSTIVPVARVAVSTGSIRKVELVRVAAARAVAVDGVKRQHVGAVHQFGQERRQVKRHEVVGFANAIGCPGSRARCLIAGVRIPLRLRVDEILGKIDAADFPAVEIGDEPVVEPQIELQ